MRHRLEELYAQKRLLQNHLDWLDSEIARESSHQSQLLSSPPDPSNPKNRDLNPLPEKSPAEAGATEPIAQDPLEIDHRAIRQEVRRGCLIYLAVFGGLSLILFALAYVLYGS